MDMPDPAGGDRREGKAPRFPLNATGEAALDGIMDSAAFKATVARAIAESPKPSQEEGPQSSPSD
jgi:hypothetical protein